MDSFNSYIYLSELCKDKNIEIFNKILATMDKKKVKMGEFEKFLQKKSEFGLIKKSNFI